MMGADTRVIGVSRRIWTAFAVLIVALTAISFFMLRGQGEIDALRAALQEARSQAKEQALALEHALADKKDLMKELSAQGERIAEFSRGEEKARSALEHASSGAEEVEKRLEKLRARLAKTEAERKRLKEEVAALQTALDGTRAELEKTIIELERLRAVTTPYAPDSGQGSAQGQ